jgi:pimeloyl-ACP methyl ester carboxylesterase
VKQTMRRLLATQTKHIADAELSRIECPTTLLWGRQDRMVPVRVGVAAAERHSWPLRVIEGAGHVPHMEQPDAFVDALTDAVRAR